MEIPARPPMPWSAARSTHLLARKGLLESDAEQTLEMWADERISSERRTVFGPIDTSANPLADVCAQLATPGLFGRPPSVSAPAGGEGLVSAGGPLAQARIWGTLARVEFLTRGMGDWLIRPEVTADKRLVLRHVNPADVEAIPYDDDPTRIRVLWELRLRWLRTPTQPEGGWVWTWDQYDLEAGTFRVVEATTKGAGMEFPGGIEGWPWVYATGERFLPFVHFRTADDGRLWHWTDQRGLHRGTLNSALHWTWAGYAAMYATGSAVLLIGARMPKSTQGSPGQQARFANFTPGCVVEVEQAGEGQPQVAQIGPGTNLAGLRDWAASYDRRLLSRAGVKAGDFGADSANPWSAAALILTDAAKRREQERLLPVFAPSVEELIRQCAALLRLAGGATYPEQGYAVGYHLLPASPEEQQAERDEEVYQVERDIISPVDVYLRRFPGVTREQAMEAMRRNREEKAALAAPADLPDLAAELRALYDAASAPDAAPADLAQMVGELLATVAPDANA